MCAAADLYVRRTGQAGPSVLLIHGSAADHSTWVMQLLSLPKLARCIGYDRRGSGQSPPAPAGYRVEDHAADAASLAEQVEEPVVVVGSSFGAVVSLELARARPELVAGLVLIEPPLACADNLPPMPAGFGCNYDRVVALEGGPAAGETFMRLVVGDRAFERMPTAWRDKACGQWAQIRADALGLTRYRPRYRQLAAVDMPVLLVGGSRSHRYFDATLSSLDLHLARARRIELAGGHMVHAEAARAFNAELTTFVQQVTGAASSPSP